MIVWYKLHKNIPKQSTGLYDIQSQTYEAMGNFKEALAYLRIATQYKDSLTTENMQKQLGELQIKYEVNKLKQWKVTNLKLKTNVFWWYACLSFW